MTEHTWFHPRGALTRGDWESVVDRDIPGWEHTGIHVAQLSKGDEVTLDDLDVERIIIPLAGAFVVTWTVDGDESTTRLAGRSSVFDGPTDVLYLSAGAHAVVSGSGRFAVASSPTEERHPSRHVLASDTAIELRGAGASSRQVHNFGTPPALDAARLIVCEVITPAENWSSYPPHKHDEFKPGQESRLEEIYYFESAPQKGSNSPASEGGAFGMFSTYSSPAGEIDINAMVKTGDIALVPYGYHGPAVAAPGYDLYYLNIMAGAGPERAWLITDDPAHTWVRDTWSGQDVDSRLPFRTEGSDRT